MNVRTLPKLSNFNGITFLFAIFASLLICWLALLTNNLLNGLFMAFLISAAVIFTNIITEEREEFSQFVRYQVPLTWTLLYVTFKINDFNWLFGLTMVCFMIINYFYNYEKEYSIPELIFSVIGNIALAFAFVAENQTFGNIWSRMMLSPKMFYFILAMMLLFIVFALTLAVVKVRDDNKIMVFMYSLFLLMPLWMNIFVILGGEEFEPWKKMFMISATLLLMVYNYWRYSEINQKINMGNILFLMAQQLLVTVYIA